MFSSTEIKCLNYFFLNKILQLRKQQFFSLDIIRFNSLLNYYLHSLLFSLDGIQIETIELNNFKVN